MNKLSFMGMSFGSADRGGFLVISAMKKKEVQFVEIQMSFL